MKTINNLRSEYKTLIVGGGIVGAGIFRDLSLHGVPSLLIDKNDFASKTSQWSSKMLHGGVRYLESYEFSLVKEALHEKNLWLKIAPHLCFENKFFLPVYEGAKRPLWMIGFGLKLYDFLSGFENTPSHTLNKSKSLEYIPELKQDGLTGCGVYCDAIVDDAKLTLENIYDGQSQDSDALSYTEYRGHKKEGDKFFVTLFDNHEQIEREIVFDHLIFALGPYTDVVLKQQYPHWSNKMILSKGIHLWVKKDVFNLKHPLLLPLNDGRVMFVIPQKDRVLLGTTETKPEHVDDVEPNPSEIQYIKENIQAFFPTVKILDEDIHSGYGGIRPLVRDQSGDLGKTSREHQTFSPEEKVRVIAGGKLTTFRIMGRDITRDICLENGISYNEDLTLGQLKQPSAVAPFQKVELTQKTIDHIKRYELVRKEEDILKRRIGFNKTPEGLNLSF